MNDLSTYEVALFICIPVCCRIRDNREESTAVKILSVTKQPVWLIICPNIPTVVDDVVDDEPKDNKTIDLGSYISLILNL